MSPRESYSDGMIFLLQGPDAVAQASSGARAFAGKREMTFDQLARLCIVVEELIANLYDHGGVTEADQVELGFESEPDAFRVTIVHPGEPFDPRSAPATRNRPERGGGAGIGIVRAWASIVDYRATSGGHRLDLLIPLDLPGQTRSG